jgi:hypothetical protein
MEKRLFNVKTHERFAVETAGYFYYTTEIHAVGGLRAVSALSGLWFTFAGSAKD